ncbi:MAG: RNA polymerase sigma factor [Phycisphaerales bacterium]
MVQTILQRIAAGDQGALKECIDRHGALVWHLARTTLSRRADLDDAVQEVFVELWKSAGRFDPSVASETTFVAMIARRRLIDRGRRERTRIARTADVGEFGGAVAPVASDAAPDAPMEQSEEAARAAAAIRLLSPEQQQALRMSIYDGLSHQEISDRLNVPLGTVKTNLRRGLIRIRELLARPTAAAVGGAGGPHS